MSLRRIRNSLRAPRTLAVLAVVGLAAAWGPTANLLRIAHSPADSCGLPPEIRMVLQSGPAHVESSRHAPRAVPGPQSACPSADQRQDAPNTPKPTALLLAISFDGESPAAPRLSSGTRDDLFHRLMHAPFGGSAQVCASSFRVLPPAFAAGPEPDRVRVGLVNTTRCLRAPRGPPLL